MDANLTTPWGFVHSHIVTILLATFVAILPRTNGIICPTTPVTESHLISLVAKLITIIPRPEFLGHLTGIPFLKPSKTTNLGGLTTHRFGRDELLPRYLWGGPTTIFDSTNK